MQTYPSESMTDTITKLWFLEMVDDAPNRMNEDGIYPPSKISATPEDLHYQKTQQQSKSLGSCNKMHSPHKAKTTTTSSNVIHIAHPIRWGAETIYGSQNTLGTH